MKEVKIIRASFRSGDPEIGILVLDGRPELLTLELPWNQNIKNLSCIPLGQYTCRRRKSEKAAGDTFEVMRVPERSAILFHPGNTIDDSQGCILPGAEIGFVNGQQGVLQSKKAFNKLMALLKGENEFALEIIHA